MIILQNPFALIIKMTHFIFKYTLITQTQIQLYHQKTHPTGKIYRFHEK